MPSASYVQTSFLSGEWSQQAQGRADKPEYPYAMNLCRNAFPVEEGSNVRRPGTKRAGLTRFGGPAVLREFHFTDAEPYTVEFAVGALRFRSRAAPVLTTAEATVASVSSSTPAVVTTTAPHGWASNREVIFRFVEPLTTPYVDVGPLIERQFIITVTGPTTFTLADGIGGVPFDGSTIDIGDNDIRVAAIYELTSPYTLAQLEGLRLVQDETDALVFERDTPTYVLRVTTEATEDDFAQFSFTEGEFLDGPYLDPPEDGSYLTPSGTSGTITLTETGSAHAFVAGDVGRLIRLLSEPEPWDIATPYAIGDKVSFGGDYWSALVANTGKQPDLDVENWAPDGGAASWTWGTIASRVSATVITVTLADADPTGVKAGGDLLYITPIRVWRLGVYCTATGFPSCGTFHEGRLWIGGLNGNRLDSSMSNKTFEFSPTLKDGTVADNCGISAIYRATAVNRPLWLLSDDQGIIVGTQAGEWLVRASQLNDPLTPTSIQAHRCTRFGCADVEPLQAPLASVFVQKGSHKIIEYTATSPPKYFLGQQLSLYAKHFFANSITELAYQSDTTPIVWAKTDEGELLGCTYRRDGQLASQPITFAGWHKHEHGAGHLYRSIQAGPSIQGTTGSLSMVTEDVFGTHYVEVLADVFEETDIIENAWQLDFAFIPHGVDLIEIGEDGEFVLRYYGLSPVGGTLTVWIAGIDAGDYVIEADGTIDVPVDSPLVPLLTTAFLAGIDLRQDEFDYLAPVYSGDFSPVPPTITYESEENTAEVTAFTNMWGISYDPGRTYVMWQDDPVGTDTNVVEFWSLTTRSSLGTVTLDATIEQPNGNVSTFPIDADGNIYALCDNFGDTKLCRWGPLGTGVQVSLGAAPFTGQAWYLAAGDGTEYIGMGASATNENGYLYEIGGVGAPVLLDTTDTTGITGDEWQIKHFCVDNYGDVWAVGGNGDLATDVCAFWRVAGSANPANDFFFVTMPAVFGGDTADVYATHCGFGGANNFVVRWANQGIALVNAITEVVDVWMPGSTSPFGVPHQLTHHRPWEEFIWSADWPDATVVSGISQLSGVDLTIGQEYEYTLWTDLSTPPGTGGMIYDSTNNGFIVTLTGAEDFAWLLFDEEVTENPILYQVPMILGRTFTTRCQVVRPVAPSDTGAANGPGFGKTRRAHQFASLLSKTQGISFGTTFDHMRAASFKSHLGVVTPLIELFSGTYEGVIEDAYTFDSMLCWEITRPYPATVVNIGSFLSTQDR